MIRKRLCFFFNDTATTEIYTLSLHDALPICRYLYEVTGQAESAKAIEALKRVAEEFSGSARKLSKKGKKKQSGDRKSTRLNSSHANISYAVFCLKKKKNLQLSAMTEAVSSYH